MRDIVTAAGILKVPRHPMGFCFPVRTTIHKMAYHISTEISILSRWWIRGKGAGKYMLLKNRSVESQMRNLSKAL